MRATVPFLCAVLLATACNRNPTLVIVNRLAPGGGGTATSSGARFDVVLRMQSDATDFRAADLLRLYLDGTERTTDVHLGGLYGILSLDPPPPGLHTVELATRRGPVFDSFTWTVAPYTGPTLTGVAPGSARVGTDVALTGTGLDAGPLRVFFGGVEGAVVTSGPTSITATVPDGALPGIVWVLVGTSAAEGIVGFQPLDTADVAVTLPTTPHIFGAFPGSAAPEQPVRVYCVNFNTFAEPLWNDRSSTRIVMLEVITVPGVGEILSGIAVPIPETPQGAGLFRLRQFGLDSNSLPFTIE